MSGGRCWTLEAFDAQGKKVGAAGEEHGAALLPPASAAIQNLTGRSPLRSG